MAKRPKDLIYAVDERPPLVPLLLLGLQYAGLMAVYLVMIVIIFKASGASHPEILSAVSLGMIALAISTMLQALRGGPIGSGFLAAPVFSAIYLGPSVLAAKSAGLPAVFGMTIIAGLVEIIMASQLSRLRRFFPPAISGFIIAIVGIELGLVAVEHVLDVENFQKPDYNRHVIVSSLTITVMIGLSVWASGGARLMCTAIGIGVGVVAAALLGIIPEAHWKLLLEVPYVALPDPSFISYDFEPSLLPAFLVAGVAAALRTVGVITACQKINDDELRRPDYGKIKGGMVADGIGCMVAGLFGTMGMNAGPSLVGVTKATGATSRYIAFSTGAFLLLFSLSPKIASLLLLLPNAVIGAALLFTASFMIAGGIQIMVTRNIDARMTYVIGISMLLGLSKRVFHDFFSGLPQILQPISSTMLSLAVVSALTLHLIFRLGSRKTATIAFAKLEHSPLELAEAMEQQATSWSVDREVMARAVSTTLQVLDHIDHAHLVQGKLAVVLSYDDYSFVVTLQYRGVLLSLPHVGIRNWNFLEEESFSYGLADFLTDAYPDRMESSARGEDISIRLHFNA
ncbi:MAG: solute carrier family 23 protein [Pseudomonadota bacterium]